MKNILKVKIKNKLQTKIHTWVLNSRLFEWMNSFFRKIAFEGWGSNKCLKKGYLPMPVDCYSPIPDLEDLKKRQVWDQRSEMYGVDFNIKGQLQLLKNLGKQYGKECVWPLHPTDKSEEFYIDNLGFSYGCAASLHTIIREFKPKRVIEIGSGHSSKVISYALKLNLKAGLKSQYLIIDPFSPDFMKKQIVNFTKIYKKRVEEMPPSFFDQLEKNDILFIDSGHTVRIGGDVNFLYLDVLPRLKPGVIIHIHDINLPYEYPKVYATQEVFRQFWTEQYLLQAFLACNKEFEVLLAMGYLMADRLKDFQKAFPNYNSKIHKFKSGSFWMRRK